MTYMAEIPDFLLNRKGLIVDAISLSTISALNLSHVLGAESKSEESIPPNLSRYLTTNGLDFAVLHNITLNDKATILKAIRSGHPILYVPSDAKRVPEISQMYDEFDAAGGVAMVRWYTTEKIIFALVMHFGQRFIKRD